MSTLCLPDATAHDQISQVFPLRICKLQVIKYWRWERPGNEAKSAQCKNIHVALCSSSHTMFPEQQNLVIHWEVGTAVKLGQHAVGRKEEKQKRVCPKKMLV